MKTKMLLFLILATKIIYAQNPTSQLDSISNVSTNPVKAHPRFFAFSPMSKRTSKVNVAFGFCHVENKRIIDSQTINGFNLEANPAPIAGVLGAFMMVMYLPDIIKNNHKRKDTIPKKERNFKMDYFDYPIKLKVNGLNLSTGFFLTTTSMNGLNISLGNKFNDFNGLSIAPLGIIADRQSGVSIGLINATNELNGLVIGGYNQSFKLDGLQLGLVNQTSNNHGVQIGVFNRSRSKGFQLGVWNKNSKRSLPIINW